MRDNLGEDEKEKFKRWQKTIFKKEDSKRKKAKCDNLDDNQIKQLRKYEKRQKWQMLTWMMKKYIYICVCVCVCVYIYKGQ